MANLSVGDSNQAIVRSFDEATESLKTTITNADVEIAVSAFTDSIKIGDGTGQTATITDLGGGVKALDVNIADIAVSHTSDSVALGDGAGLLTSTVSGPKRALDVNLLSGSVTGTFTQAPSGETILVYGENLSLAIGATTTVVTYTAGSGVTRYTQRVYTSSTQVATFVVEKNAVVVLTTRLNPTKFSDMLDFATGSAFGIKIETGDTIAIKATNDGSAIAEVNSTIQFMET